MTLVKTETEQTRWPPYQHVFFDCDSTLTTVEGIDVLAEQAGRGENVRRLTEAAMNGEMDLEDVYGDRLKQINPTRTQVQSLRQVYKDNVVADAAMVISVLQHLGHDTYIISGGLEEPVREFGVSLGVPADHIRAVGVEFDELVGAWWSHHPGQEASYLDYGRGALAVSEGKEEIVEELMGGRPGRSLLVGDGTSDLLASEAVDLFIGFGGVASRPKVEKGAPAFIRSQDLAPVLPLAAGPSAVARLQETSYRSLFTTGVQQVREATTFNDGSLGERFASAVTGAGF
ncbi:MAG: HAD-IB family phosphatase [Acidimicrobiia bacterium]